MIRTEALTKYYGSRCAVKELSVSIASREIVGFLGLNGAGKTTALRMLAGQLQPSGGRIEIEGRDMVTGGREMRWRIGFLPERPPLYEDMSVTAYLDFAARLRGFDPSKVERRRDEVLELTSLKETKDELIGSLSHGFKQRVGIAQAIIHDPSLVILDEPNNGLDPTQIVEMRTLIRELRNRHTVLLSSHILSEISQTCDRLLIILKGELAALGTEAELTAKLSATRRVRVELTAAGDAVDRALIPLKASGLVTSFERHERGAHQEVLVTLEKDQPEALAQALVGAGLGLRRLQPAETGLEDVFRQLTVAKA